MWKNILEPGRLQMTIWPMRFVCWITKATDTHSEYVILIAFPLQHWSTECFPVIRYTYIGCLVTDFTTFYFTLNYKETDQEL